MRQSQAMHLNQKRRSKNSFYPITKTKFFFIDFSSRVGKNNAES